MEWEMPPLAPGLKLVATERVENDIVIHVIGEDFGSRAYRMTEIYDWDREGLREYILSLKEKIISGVYDIKLTNQDM